VNVRLHIDRLVLDGIAVPQVDHPQLREAVERELVRLIGEGGVSSSFETGTAWPAVDGSDLRIRQGVSARDLGTQIAGALYGGLRR
jgi:hypothetical protein